MFILPIAMLALVAVFFPAAPRDMLATVSRGLNFTQPAKDQPGPGAAPPPPPPPTTTAPPPPPNPRLRIFIMEKYLNKYKLILPSKPSGFINPHIYSPSLALTKVA